MNFNLVGGLEHFLFSIIYGIILPFTNMFQRVWNHQPVNPLEKTPNFQSFLEFESHEPRFSWGLDDDFPLVSTIPQDRCASVCLFDSFPVNPTIYEILWFNSIESHKIIMNSTWNHLFKQPPPVLWRLWRLHPQSRAVIIRISSDLQMSSADFQAPPQSKIWSCVPIRRRRVCWCHCSPWPRRSRGSVPPLGLHRKMLCDFSMENVMFAWTCMENTVFFETSWNITIIVSKNSTTMINCLKHPIFEWWFFRKRWLFFGKRWFQHKPWRTWKSWKIHVRAINKCSTKLWEYSSKKVEIEHSKNDRSKRRANTWCHFFWTGHIQCGQVTGIAYIEHKIGPNGHVFLRDVKHWPQLEPCQFSAVFRVFISSWNGSPGTTQSMMSGDSNNNRMEPCDSRRVVDTVDLMGFNEDII